MKKAEHIAAYFEPFGVNSLLAGVSPAEVHNPAPRELPLVSGGATPIGDGVLGKAKRANVVFCQLVPYVISKGLGAVPSLVVSAEDAVDGKQSALVTMATVPSAQFTQKVEAGQVGKTYTFAVSVKGVGGPVRARLEVERAGSPWDRAVRGADTTFAADEWTELHVTFKVEKPYPEGWTAYIHCGQEGARFRADLFRLYEGNYVPGRPVAEGQNLFTNASFEAGTKPWRFSYRTAQHNLKRTYRRSCFLITRLLANMGVAGSTPLLERFSSPVGASGAVPLVKNGGFRADADGDGVADEWAFSSGSRKTKATCTREKMRERSDAWSQVLTCPPADGDDKPSMMLAQSGVPMSRGQWYRISFSARAERLAPRSVDMTITNTAVWRSLFPQQRFAPGQEWKRFTFEVQSNDTVEKRTRLQIYHRGTGKLCLSDVLVEPISDPAKGRWLEGLYMDTPEEWDDPYRFFRW